jgi:hypothetical protein
MANSDVTLLTWFRKGLRFGELHSETGEIFPFIDSVNNTYRWHVGWSYTQYQSELSASPHQLVDEMPLPL